jgi:hypothetical protein
MTLWVLVHKDHAPDKRRILCSCESFLKRSLTSDGSGTVSENIMHGIASVFCPVSYRRRGYAARMMRELSKVLYTWQMKQGPCVGTTLYSEIRKYYYVKLGWLPNRTNSHIEIRFRPQPWPLIAREITESDLGNLCQRDEAITRSRIGVPTKEFDTRFTIIPDLEHMGWHSAKEIFATTYLFEKPPAAKGATAGSPGSQIWALWTHRYYGRHDIEPKRNVLYILRLVLEVDETATTLLSDARKRPNKAMYEQQSRYFKLIFQTPQAEASDWKLDVIELWDPTSLVSELLARSGIDYDVVERKETNIASLQWYDAAGAMSRTIPLWMNNEHYA